MKILTVFTILLGLTTVGLLIGVIVLAVTRTPSTDCNIYTDMSHSTPMSVTSETSMTTGSIMTNISTSVTTDMAITNESTTTDVGERNLSTSVTSNMSTNNTTTTSNPEFTFPRVAFMASCQSNSFPNSLISFDTVSINEGLCFDEENNSFFSVPEDGFYWFHLSAGIPANHFCNYAMNTGNISLSIIKTRYSHPGLDVTSRDNLLSLKKGQKLSVSSTFQLHSDELKQTSWIGLRLDSIMSPFVAFSLAHTKPNNPFNYIPFDTIFVDTHFAWDSKTHSYIIPFTGLYFLSFHATTNTSTFGPYYVALYVTTSKLTSSFQMNQDNGKLIGSVTISTSLLRFLQEGDTLKLAGGNLYCDNTYQTSFAGFLYTSSTVTGEAKIAWFATDCSSYLGIDNVTISNGYTGGYVNPVPFPNVIVNEGFGWNIAKQTFTAVEAGLYYVYLSGGSYQGYKFSLQICHNGQPIASLKRDFPSRDIFIRSRAILLRLNVNDELRVIQQNGTEEFGYYNVSFMGFRLFA